MNKYIYPQNLRAIANLWLWSLRDFTILLICALLSVLILTQSGILLPLAATVVFGILSVRMDGLSILEYIRFAGRFLIASQQYYEWQERSEQP